MSGIQLVAFDFFGTLGHFDRRRPTSPVYLLWAERDRARPVDLDVLAGMVEGANGQRQFDHAPTDAEYRDWQTGALRSAAGYAGVAWSGELHRRLLDTLDRRELVLFGDTLPAVRALRDLHVSWGVSSNASPDVEGKLLDALPTDLHPDVTLMSCRVGARKPHPDMFRPLLSYVDSPDQILFVGDRMDADILGPSRLGFRTALIVRGPDAAAPPGTPVLRALTDIHSLITQETA